MTDTEKFNAIVERLKKGGIGLTPAHISTMVIMGHLNFLKENGIISSSCEVTQMGKDAMAICEEFDWKPTDSAISRVINDMVDAPEREAMRHFVIQLRDNREEFLKMMKKVKDQENP